MISGYLSSRQDFVDLINSYLFNKQGVLEIYIEGRSIELYVENGFIKGFYTETEGLKAEEINKKSLLLYSLFDILDNPSALFSFKNSSEREYHFKLEEPISAEELVLQLQLAYQEFKSLLNLIITPYATIRVLKPFENMQNYEGRTFISVILTSNETLTSEIRKLQELLRAGFLDIGQFSTPEAGKRIYEVDYILKDVSIKNVNIFSVLESLMMSKFTGYINIHDNYNNYELYIQKGKPIALYPHNFDFFDLILTPRADLATDVVSMPGEIINKFILKHSNRRLISGLPDSFIELGKIFIGIIKSGFTGLLMLQKANERMYFAYDNGVLLASLLENEELKTCNANPYRDGFLVDLISFEPMENFLEVMHLLFINVVYGIILRHSNQVVQSISYYLSSSDLFKMIEGSIYFRVDPRGRREEILGFLSFLLDVGYKILGKKKLEEELENSLHPYRDIFKVLEVEEYVEFWNEGAIS
ncbi:MAG: hypothetical protein ACO2PP_04560 [Thermocrinis sp.]|jgi:hypothetical protein|uniref:hypothetical protein n=1 Tax=Thermocrinis sp. TaxID=2024383 RepID=UPI003C0AA307